MQDVTAGKDAGHAGLEALVYHWAARHARKLDACRARELVLGQEPHREEQRVARVALLRARNGAALLVHLSNPHGLDPALALDTRDGMREQ